MLHYKAGDLSVDAGCVASRVVHAVSGEVGERAGASKELDRSGAGEGIVWAKGDEDLPDSVEGAVAVAACVDGPVEELDVPRRVGVPGKDPRVVHEGSRRAERAGRRERAVTGGEVDVFGDRERRERATLGVGRGCCERRRRAGTEQSERERDGDDGAVLRGASSCGWLDELRDRARARAVGCAPHPLRPRGRHVSARRRA